MNQTLLTALVGSGILVALAQLITALATFIRQKANAVTLNTKIDANTVLTADIHKVTNGTLSTMGQNVTALAVQAASNAAEARSTAEAAKVQAAIDAKSDLPKSLGDVP